MENDLFDKKVSCPICNSEFTQKAVKVNSPRIISKDTDFFLRYKAINPYFYDIWICNSCGYAALKSEFNKIRDKQKEIFLNTITKKWSPKNYPNIYSLDIAIERYKLALITAKTINKRSSTLGILSIKLGWMYRLKEDFKNEAFFLDKALLCFLDAFMNEPFPIFGLHRDGLTYLIGELYRRTEDSSNALIWYSKVILSTNSSSKIKEMARTSRYALKDKLDNS